MSSYNIDTLDESEDIDEFYERNIELAYLDDLNNLIESDYESRYESDDSLNEALSKIIKESSRKKILLSKKTKYKRKSTRKQNLFRKSSKFHMMDKDTRNKIMDRLEAGISYAKISREFNIEYQNLLKWKRKGVLKRPEYDWPQ
jgi:uncharacterized protein (DUF2344 family)